ncbi:replication protein A 70 kDa DNA-binding subunit A-like [Silene latifolia]|uniref:replication protein A 70 kDa DNA-binding subunit A-like n=1 Tax=Silene latifolia TaxID=37657 RepID=UPI003D77C32F
MIEGCIYKLGKFTASENVGYMTATKNLWRIRFKYSTYAILITDPHIPKFGFSFTSFPDIIDEHVKPNTYLDVIGVFEMLHPIAVSEQRNEWTHVDLTDKHNNRLSFYIFGDYVKQIVQINNDYASAKERPILALQCVIRTEWKGTVRIKTSFDATRIYVNPDIPEVMEFKKRVGAS